MCRSKSSRRATLAGVVLSLGFFAAPLTAVGAQGDCSQPQSMGASPVASDCLFILQVAIGLLTCTPQPCVCDPTGDDATTATDALTCLKKAVGQAIVLLCPCSTTTTTVPISDCINDGNCFNDDCVCSDCDNDLFCRNPDNCNDNGVCQTFQEGCVCADCMTHPECLDN